MVIHRVQVVNVDGEYRPLCGQKSSSTFLDWDWKVVTCKRCLKMKPKSAIKPKVVRNPHKGFEK